MGQNLFKVADIYLSSLCSFFVLIHSTIDIQTFFPESVLLPSSALEVKLGGSQGEKLGSSRQRPGGRSPGSEGEGLGHSGGREIITKEVLY